MNRKSIIILVLIAAILAAVIYTLLIKEPLIEQVIITEKKSLSETELLTLANNNTSEFVLKNNSDIYAVFKVKNLENGNTINIKWFIVKDNKVELIQEDSFATKKEGSGQIVVGLIMKNRAHQPGNYKMEYTLSGGPPISVNFIIK